MPETNGILPSPVEISPHSQAFQNTGYSGVLVPLEEGLGFSLTLSSLIQGNQQGPLAPVCFLVSSVDTLRGAL